MLKEFKNFISRGNVIDMAVGVIIGAAFTGIVRSLTRNLINPLIGIFMGKINFSSLVLRCGSAQFRIGAFFNSVINFLIIALVVFFLIKTINAITHRKKQVQLTKSEQLLTEIRDLLKNSDRRH